MAGTPKDKERLRDRLEVVPGLAEQYDRLEALRQRIAAEQPEQDSDAANEKKLWLALIGYLEGVLQTTDLLLISETWVGELGGAIDHLTHLLDTYGLAAPGGEKGSFIDFVRRSLLVVGTGKAAQRLSSAAQAARSEEERLRTAADALEAKATELGEVVEGFTTETSESRANESKEFAEVLQTGRAQIAASREQAEKALESDRAEISREAQRVLAESADVLDELRSRLSIAADESLSADYGNRANKEMGTADLFRWIAAIFGVLVVVSAAVVLKLQVDASESAKVNSWDLLPAKIALVGALVALATYFGRESSRHRAYGQQLRNAQLELHNLGPYLAELPAPQRAIVRERLVDTFFGKPVETVKEDAPTNGATVEQLLDVIKAIISK